MDVTDDAHPVPTERDFLRLFVRHEPVLRAYARSILPTWDAVEDALQEASVVMWEKLGQLDGDDGFLPWAKVIVRFKCLAVATKLRRTTPILSDEVLARLAEEAAEPSRFDEVRASLTACLDTFSHEHRELLLAPYGGGDQVQELAERAGKSANAFYKLLGRLRAKLTDCVRSRLRTAGV